ncbi:MAG: phosphoenolpyruvate--protein phosphotransferase, partial [Planctomycetota bacterium]|nr:phosphoenolpyruvate--protein phosphotransferase [Planctomycetota bacterium]
QRVYLRPDQQITDEYTRVISEQESSEENLHALNHLPAATRDHQSITLRANVGLISDLQSAKKFRAEGIGLYRTEFPFMVRSEFPNRDEQYSLYRRVLETFPDHPVTFRTLDIGGDKSLPYFSSPKEENPFLGWRSIRVSLDYPEIFQTQIEAILMASSVGNARLMFPMIISVEEFHRCLAIVEQAKRRLAESEIEYGDVPIGVMIETPATVAIAKYLGRNADFFSIGTNDLVQYMVGADRGNSRVSEQYQPLHPGVLGAIDTMVEVASATDCSLSMCGEMVNDFRILAMLTGMGVREFSVSAPLIPALKRDLKGHELKRLKGLAHEALQLASEEEVRGLLKDFFDD